MHHHRKIRMYLINQRQKLGYTQYKVALLMGVCHQHYQKIESGAIGKAIQFKTIYALSNALDIPIELISIQEMKYQESLIKEEEPLGDNKK